MSFRKDLYINPVFDINLSNCKKIASKQLKDFNVIIKFEKKNSAAFHDQ